MWRRETPRFSGQRLPTVAQPVLCPKVEVGPPQAATSRSQSQPVDEAIQRKTIRLTAGTNRCGSQAMCRRGSAAKPHL